MFSSTFSNPYNTKLVWILPWESMIFTVVHHAFNIIWFLDWDSNSSPENNSVEIAIGQTNHKTTLA